MQIVDAPSARLVMSDHSSALPVSYFGETGPDLSEYEVRSRNFFFNLRSLPVYEARQLTTLLSILQNRKERARLKDAAFGTRTLAAARAALENIYHTIASRSDFESIAMQGISRTLEDYSQTDVDVLRAFGMSGEKGEVMATLTEAVHTFAKDLEDMSASSGLPAKDLIGYLRNWHSMSFSDEFGNRPSFTDYLTTQTGKLLKKKK